VTGPPATVRFRTPRGRAHVRFTTRADGDLNADVVPTAVLAARWQAVAERPVVWLDEEHGTNVVVVDGDGPERLGRATRWSPPKPLAPSASGSATARPSPSSPTRRGRRAPRRMARPRRRRAAETVAAMRSLGATRIDAVVGPCIHAECYEFGPPISSR
jgi:copper oxidase (laccase) domain-containing protein